MQQLIDLLSTGDYGGYILSAYVAAFAITGWMLFSSYNTLRRAERLLRMIEKER